MLDAVLTNFVISLQPTVPLKTKENIQTTFFNLRGLFQTGDSISSGYRNTEKRFENMTCSGVFFFLILFYFNDVYWFSVLDTILLHATLTCYPTTLTYTHIHIHINTSSSSFLHSKQFFFHIYVQQRYHCTLLYFVFAPFYIVSWHFIIRFGYNCFKLVNQFNFGAKTLIIEGKEVFCLQ